MLLWRDGESDNINCVGSGKVGAHTRDNLRQWDRQIAEIEREKWKERKRRGEFESTRSFVSNLPSFY